MKDRVAVNPGRVLITPENGSPYYATMTRADNPTQEGTPLNKNSLLKDTTAALLGGGTDMVPDEALQALKRLIDAGDAATLAAAAKAEFGTYSGASAASKTLTFGFAPRLVIVRRNDELDKYDARAYGIYALSGMTKAGVMESHKDGTSGFKVVTLTWSGNSVSWSGDTDYYMNASGQTYYYAAFV